MTWSLPVQGLAGTGVQPQGDLVALGLGQGAEVGALGPVLAQQAVGVLVCAALPGRLWVAEVDRIPVAPGSRRAGHLIAAVPGDRLAQAQRERRRSSRQTQTHPREVGCVAARERGQQNEAR